MAEDEELRGAGPGDKPVELKPATDDELARGEAGVDQPWYLATYPDVAAAGMDPVAHYLEFGWREGRNPRRNFSTRGYLAIHAGVARAGRNPFIHYLRHGGAKGPLRDVAPSSWPVHSGSLGRMARATAWWDYKLVPVFSIFYATALAQDVSVAAIWPAAVVLLLAIVPCAAYVSFVNDVTDRAVDLRAGKPNGLADLPPWRLALLLAVPLSVGAVFGFLWRDDPPLMTAYLCAWAAFSLYSVPPFRLKSRGILGVIADACGAHLFPTLVAVFLCIRAAGRDIDPIWIAAVAAWALACGLRGILWHQVIDLESDRKAGVQTFALRHSRRSAERLATHIALPVELIALAVLLWRMQSVWPVVGLLAYAGFALLRSRLWKVAIVVGAPRERYTVLGQEYYSLWFPLGILTALALRHPVDAAVLVAHLLVFPGPAMWFAMQAGWMLRDLVHSSR